MRLGWLVCLYWGSFFVVSRREWHQKTAFRDVMNYLCFLTSSIRKVNKVILVCLQNFSIWSLFHLGCIFLLQICWGWIKKVRVPGQAGVQRTASIYCEAAQKSWKKWIIASQEEGHLEEILASWLAREQLGSRLDVLKLNWEGKLEADSGQCIELKKAFAMPSEKVRKCIRLYFWRGANKDNLVTWPKLVN